MTRLRVGLLPALSLAAAAACSSWDTGSDLNDAGEKACKDTVEAFARASERCGQDYKTSYDFFLMRDANGDCKNVRSVRDEASLRQTCIPIIQSMECTALLAGESDASCSKQLQRTASLSPALR